MARLGIGLFIIYLSIAFACVYGYFLNIMALINSGLALVEYGALEIIRIIGIFMPPVGIFMGYFF